MSKPLTEFEYGYLIACANISNLHNEPCIAADVAMELGVTWSQIVKAGFDEYDMAALKEIREARPIVFVKVPSAKRRASTREQAA